MNAMTTTNTAVLQVRNLSFSYPGLHVLTHWSADIAPGLTWLRGANGSGKSSLLKLLAGALPPLTGDMAVRGISAAADPLGYRREVFWCGPGGVAFDHLRPPEYFALLRGLYPRWDAPAVPPLVQALGLQPFLDTRLAALSTGTQRKVALLAALVVGSSVVLLDEPLNALDAASLAVLRQQLAQRHAAAAQAWLVASHTPPLLAGDGPELATIDLDPL
jgi:ABC-type multidrug transport system ATPase subunit